MFGTFNFTGGTNSEPIHEIAVKMMHRLAVVTEMVDSRDSAVSDEVLLPARSETTIELPLVFEGRGLLADCV